MAQAIYQYSMYLSDPKEGVGWSEQVVEGIALPSVGSTAGLGAPTFIKNMQDATNWANKRSQFLSSDARIDAVVRRQVGQRNTQLFIFDTPIDGNVNLETNEESEVSIDYYLRTAGGLRRFYWVRSVSSNWVEGGKLTDLGRNGLKSIDAYFRFVTNNPNIGIRSTDQEKQFVNVTNLPPVAGAVQPISIIFPGGAVGPPAISDGDLIRLTQLRGFPYVNGVWKVMNVRVVGGDLYADLKNSARYQGISATFANVQIINPTVFVVNGFGFQRCGRHKCGVPFGRQRGRSSAKVLHSR